jgi:hypothetical protein
VDNLLGTTSLPTANPLVAAKSTHIHFFAELASLQHQRPAHRITPKQPGSAAYRYSYSASDDSATADQHELMETSVGVEDMYSSSSTLCLFAKLQGPPQQEADLQAVVKAIQQRAQHGSHTEAVLQALLAISAHIPHNVLYSLLDLAMSPNYSNVVISSSCAAACQALTAAISCFPLVREELQRQLLKAFQEAEELLLAGLEHGSPAAKKLAVQVCMLMFEPAVGQRRIAGSANGIKWLQVLFAVLGIEQVTGVAAGAAAPSESNWQQQQQPEPSLAWMLLEAITCVTEHIMTTGQLCQRPKRSTTGIGRKGEKQCGCDYCTHLLVMNLKPLLRAMQHGSSKAAAALAGLAAAPGVQSQLATPQGLSELLSTSWQHRDTAAGTNTEYLLRRLVQNSSLGSAALEQHMQAVVAELAIEQYTFLSPTDLEQTLAGCLALLKMTATSGVAGPHLVQCVHSALGTCIPSLVELSVGQQACTTPAVAATLLLQALAQQQPQLLTAALMQHKDSLKKLLGAADAIESREGGISMAGALLLAATASSVHGSVDLLMAVGKQPYLDSLVQQLHNQQRTASVLVERIAATEGLDTAWLQHDVLQQLLDTADGDVQAASHAASRQNGTCSSAGVRFSTGTTATAAAAAKALLAAVETRHADMLAGQLVKDAGSTRRTLLCLLKAAETDNSKIGVAGSLLLAATASNVQGSTAVLRVLSERYLSGILKLLCSGGNSAAAVLVHRMSALQELDTKFLQSCKLQQLLDAALKPPATNPDVASYALKAVWALFSISTAQGRLQQLPLQQLLVVVEALAAHAHCDDAAGSIPAKMAALKVETLLDDPCKPQGGTACGAPDRSQQQQQQMQRGALAALQLLEGAATADGVGAVAAAWEVQLQLSRSSDGCSVLMSSKAGATTIVALLTKHLAQGCSAAAPPEQHAAKQASTDALLVATLTTECGAAAAAVNATSAVKAAAVLAGLATHAAEGVTEGLLRQQQQLDGGFSVVLQAMFHSADSSAAKHACTAIRLLTSDPHVQKQAAVACLDSCGGLLVQLMQQGWVAAARLLAGFAQVAAAEQSCKLVPHLTGLEIAARSINPEVATLAAQLLQGIAAAECLGHIEQLVQWMQQGSAAATHLLAEVAGLSAAKQQLLPHLPAVMGGAACSAAAEKVLQAWVAPECLSFVGQLVQLVQQDSESTAGAAAAAAAAAATLLHRLMQLPGGKLPGLQHLSALVTAAGSSSSEVASAVNILLSELEVPECITHLSELLQLMQQGKVAAAELVVRLSQLPAAKTAFVQHVPALVTAVAADSNAIATAAVVVLHDLTCCSMAESSAGISAATATAAATALATQDLSPLMQCISTRPAVAAMCVSIVATTAPHMTSTPAGIVALEKYIPQLLAAAEALAATGSAGSQSLAELVVSSMAAVAARGKGGLEAVQSCIPRLAAALCSNSRAIVDAALKALHLLLSDSSTQAAVLQEVAKQQCLGQLVLRLKVSGVCTLLIKLGAAPTVLTAVCHHSAALQQCSAQAVACCLFWILPKLSAIQPL